MNKLDNVVTIRLSKELDEQINALMMLHKGRWNNKSDFIRGAVHRYIRSVKIK
jgi:Arc/MetJ-type ribon-helix-helix transcriptional regulator